jgi:hypothetical protein
MKAVSSAGRLQGRFLLLSLRAPHYLRFGASFAGETL